MSMDLTLHSVAHVLFFRQMNRAVRAENFTSRNRRLYQIKRKKREEIRRVNARLNKILISWRGGCAPEKPGDDKEVTATQTEGHSRITRETRQANAKPCVATEGDFETYLSHRNSKSGKLPRIW